MIKMEKKNKTPTNQQQLKNPIKTTNQPQKTKPNQTNPKPNKKTPQTCRLQDVVIVTLLNTPLH